MQTISFRMGGIPCEVTSGTNASWEAWPELTGRWFEGIFYPERKPLDVPFDFRSTYRSSDLFTMLQAMASEALGQSEVVGFVRPN